jgi:hypothetical protein
MRRVSLMPLLIWPGQEQERHFSPIIYIPRPIEGPFDSHREVTASIASSMQAGILKARDLSEQYPAVPAKNRRQLHAQRIISKLLTEAS